MSVLFTESSIFHIIVLIPKQASAVGSASDSWSLDTCQSLFRAPSKTPVVSLSH